MHHFFLRAFRAFVLVLVTAVVTTAVPAAVRAADPIVVNVGTLPTDGSANVFYAQDLGYFKAVGLDAHIQTMGSGPIVAQAIAGGAIDIGVVNVATVSAAYLRGLHFKYIAPADIASPQTQTDLMMVLKDSPIQKASDLNGKTIALNGLKDLQQLCAMAWVDKHGGDSKTLKFVEVPFPEMGAALVQKRVDAAMMVEPFVSAGRATGRSIGEDLDGVGTNYMIVGWVATDSWLATHADVAARFQSAILKASVWANSHKKESAAILLRHTKLKPEVVEAM
ncbi:MAG TPA: ABC transporter substrate-binding protein, partial [Candidatus Aquilonibacter sp.]